MKSLPRDEILQDIKDTVDEIRDLEYKIRHNPKLEQTYRADIIQHEKLLQVMRDRLWC